MHLLNASHMYLCHVVNALMSSPVACGFMEIT